MMSKGADTTFGGNKMNLSLTPIGYMNTCFARKNGTPRQATVSAASRGRLTILKSVFNNPEHSLVDLNLFSHVWILFYFHLNQNKGVKAKVKPPRLHGEKTGVFATRSPHRPNAIGLTLAKLVEVKEDTLHFSGVDIVDGTPVLDVKPFIPEYDNPSVSEVLASSNSYSLPSSVKMDVASAELMLDAENKDICKENDELMISGDKLTMHGTVNHVSVAEWVSPNPKSFNVVFSSRAMKNIQHFKNDCSSHEIASNACPWTLDQIEPDKLAQVIRDILTEDPRSTYRKQKCLDKLYYFTVANVHVTAWFDDVSIPNCFEVVRCVPSCLVKHTGQ